MTACGGCGFVYEQVGLAEISAALAALGPGFRAALEHADGDVACTRPAPQVWSAREYASHVRDVLLVQRERVVLACVEPRPSFARMHRDERVAICRYDAFDMSSLLDQLQMAAELCAVTFARLDAVAWSRRFVYNWPEPAEHDLAWLGRHALHEGTHHLDDVRRILGRDGSGRDGSGDS